MARVILSQHLAYYFVLTLSVFSPYMCTWMGLCAETVWRSYPFLVDSRRTCQSCKRVVKEGHCLPENGQGVEEVNALVGSVCVFLAMQVNVDYNLSCS